MHNKKEVILYQELSTNAHPPLYTFFHYGWILRLSEGYTKRANSVLPLNYFGLKLRDDIALVEQIYSSHNLPVIFQLSDYFAPQQLSSELLSLGYSKFDESLIMGNQISHLHSLSINSNFTVTVSSSQLDWSNNYAKLANQSKDNMFKHQAILNRILLPKAYCFAKSGDKIVGLGLGVLERNFLGIYSMITHSAFRRQGVGLSILTQLINWGKNNLATDVYLQVQGDNLSAIALYQKIGLKDLFHYRYYEKK